MPQALETESENMHHAGHSYASSSIKPSEISPANFANTYMMPNIAFSNYLQCYSHSPLSLFPAIIYQVNTICQPLECFRVPERKLPVVNLIILACLNRLAQGESAKAMVWCEEQSEIGLSEWKSPPLAVLNALYVSLSIYMYPTWSCWIIISKLKTVDLLTSYDHRAEHIFIPLSSNQFLGMTGTFSD